MKSYSILIEQRVKLGEAVVRPAVTIGTLLATVPGIGTTGVRVVTAVLTGAVVAILQLVVLAGDVAVTLVLAGEVVLQVPGGPVLPAQRSSSTADCRGVGTCWPGRG